MRSLSGFGPFLALAVAASTGCSLSPRSLTEAPEAARDADGGSAPVDVTPSTGGMGPLVEAPPDDENPAPTDEPAPEPELLVPSGPVLLTTLTKEGGQGSVGVCPLGTGAGSCSVLDIPGMGASPAGALWLPPNRLFVSTYLKGYMVHVTPTSATVEWEHRYEVDHSAIYPKAVALLTDGPETDFAVIKGYFLPSTQNLSDIDFFSTQGGFVRNAPIYEATVFAASHPYASGQYLALQGRHNIETGQALAVYAPFTLGSSATVTSVSEKMSEVAVMPTGTADMRFAWVNEPRDAVFSSDSVAETLSAPMSCQIDDIACVFYSAEPDPLDPSQVLASCGNHDKVVRVTAGDTATTPCQVVFDPLAFDAGFKINNLDLKLPEPAGTP
ncbi:MAG: hypothetical protein AAGA56_26255 [Myxococcota bacterium]